MFSGVRCPSLALQASVGRQVSGVRRMKLIEFIGLIQLIVIYVALSQRTMDRVG
jgi:hypothetical protein